MTRWRSKISTPPATRYLTRDARRPLQEPKVDQRSVKVNETHRGLLMEELPMRKKSSSEEWGKVELCRICFKEMFSEIKGQHGTTAKSEVDIFKTHQDMTSPVSPVSGRNQRLCSLWASSVFNHFCLYVIFRTCLFLKCLCADMKYLSWSCFVYLNAWLPIWGLLCNYALVCKSHRQTNQQTVKLDKLIVTCVVLILCFQELKPSLTLTVLSIKCSPHNDLQSLNLREYFFFCTEATIKCPHM